MHAEFFPTEKLSCMKADQEDCNSQRFIFLLKTSKSFWSLFFLFAVETLLLLFFFFFPAYRTISLTEFAIIVIIDAQ